VDSWATLRGNEDQARRLHPTDAAREALVNPNKALWEKGDFTRTAQSIAESEELVARMGRLKLSC
jgi:hypothetical protein